MIELIPAKLADEGLSFSDYPEALQHFFTYLARTACGEDLLHRQTTRLRRWAPSASDVQIIDPGTVANNVSRLYTDANASAIYEAAIDAGYHRLGTRRPLANKRPFTTGKVFGSYVPGFKRETCPATRSPSTTFTVTHARHMAGLR